MTRDQPPLQLAIQLIGHLVKAFMKPRMIRVGINWSLNHYFTSNGDLRRQNSVKTVAKALSETAPYGKPWE